VTLPSPPPEDGAVDWSCVDDALGALLAPFSVARFVGEHFNRRALHVPGAAGKFRGLLDPELLLSDLETGFGGRISEVRAGFRDGRGDHREITVRADEARDVLAGGMTVVVANPETVYPRLEALLRQLRTGLCIPDAINMACFISPAGAGYGLHYDPSSVWAIQLTGTKIWRISETPAVPFPSRVSIPTRADLAAGLHPCDPDSLVDRTLRPGDLLYLPPGAWHDVRAEEPCIHLSVAHFYRGLAEIVFDLLRPALQASPSWRHTPVLGAVAAPAETRRALAETLAARLAEFREVVTGLTPSALSAAIAERVDAGAGAPALPDGEAELISDPDPDQTFVLDQHAFVASIDPARDRDEALCLFRSGTLFATLPEDAAPVVKEMRRRGRFSGRELLSANAGLSWSDVRELFKALVEARVLAP
jgi:ribosomal protein L16 Arg81 hydroxylase